MHDMNQAPSSRNDGSQIILRPVGVVRSTLKELERTPGRLSEATPEDLEAERQRVAEIRSLISEIIIDERLDGILDGIEDFSHILVLYWPHRLPHEKRDLIKVHPMGRKDLPLVGVFATCSPARPNPILVTAVRLIKRDHNVLKVQGLEAIDGSPVLDIKPYSPHYYLVKDPKLSNWMLQVMKETGGENRGEAFYTEMECDHG
jgi:tRNA-Thr(GGU) m(6)t(6)A37 methyltransferase TsaA